MSLPTKPSHLASLEQPEDGSSIRKLKFLEDQEGDTSTDSEQRSHDIGARNSCAKKPALKEESYEPLGQQEIPHNPLAPPPADAHMELAPDRRKLRFFEDRPRKTPGFDIDR